MPTPPGPDNPVPLPPPERFDPADLDRSIIAIPLLEKIEREKAIIRNVRQNYPNEAKQFNCMILYKTESKMALSAIQAELKQLVDEALANAESDVDRDRHKIGKRYPDDPDAVFAWLDARTVRRILNRQGIRQSRGIERPVIIRRIVPERFKIIIDLNLDFIGGRDKAREWVEEAAKVALTAVDDPGQGINEEKSRDTNQYVFATMEADVIGQLVEMDAEPVTEQELAVETKIESKPKAVKVELLRQLLGQNVPAGQQSGGLAAVSKAKCRAIHRIWPDFEVRARITKSISTVKANAAINSFSARGKDILWAVLDTGIQGDHPHFQLRKNILDPTSPLHRDFTSGDAHPLADPNGHGTHVAGIIAGEWVASKDENGKPIPLNAVARYQDEHGDEQQEVIAVETISGMAPECRLVSLKVLDENGIGNASNLIAAIAHVQEVNGYGRRILIHGINISIGYDFDPKWFACGQSPLCVEVDRLVKSGVVVVVAAGNTGYGAVNNGSSSAGLTVTINDPGNAELAITVGATHRDMPHVYGVSYFSSKGPTGDGRPKPDLVAPGEKIISCASSLPAAPDAKERRPSELKREVAHAQTCDYIETSGTSMAAPHVSGLVAAFLSVRREFIGQPEEVKRIFLSTCTDLRRDRYFQGAGLIDLMRAIQSV